MYRAALVAGADALELDLQMTKDGVLVVAHSADASECTDCLRYQKRYNSAINDAPLITTARK